MRAEIGAQVEPGMPARVGRGETGGVPSRRARWRVAASSSGRITISWSYEMAGGGSVVRRLQKQEARRRSSRTRRPHPPMPTLADAPIDAAMPDAATMPTDDHARRRRPDHRQAHRRGRLQGAARRSRPSRSEHREGEDFKFDEYVASKDTTQVLRAVISDRSLFKIEVLDPMFTTAAGIGVGATAEELAAKTPDLKCVYETYDPNQPTPSASTARCAANRRSLPHVMFEIDHAKFKGAEGNVSVKTIAKRKITPDRLVGAAGIRGHTAPWFRSPSCLHRSLRARAAGRSARRQPHPPGDAGVLLARRADRGAEARAARARARGRGAARSRSDADRPSSSTCSPATACCRAWRRTRRATAAISSARGPASSATAARSRSARSSTAPARPGRSSSRAPGPRRTRDAPTVARCCARRCASSCAARRCIHLGVPTTRALSLVLTGEPVLRDMLYDGNPQHEPGAVVCRVAPIVPAVRQLRDPRVARRPRHAAQARAVHARALLPAVRRRRSARHRRLLRRGRAAHRVDGRRVDARRLRARRDEHRQHVDPRAHDRLRTVRLARAVRSRLDAEHHRRVGPALPVRQPAAGRALEPRAARARARAAGRRHRAAARRRSTRSRT